MMITLTKIGNSKGIIIPAAVLKQCGLSGSVALKVEEGKLVISKINAPRDNWEALMAKAEKDNASLDIINNDFDDTEWTW